MRILALDTSTDYLSVALWEDGLLAQRSAQAVTTSAMDTVYGWLDEIFDETDLPRQSLDAVAFGSGPGSFTGIRTACSMAHGIAVGLNLSALAVPTLAALAWQVQARRIVASIDARMQEVYFAAYEKKATGLVTVTAPCVLPPSAVQLPAGDSWVTCGNAYVHYALPKGQCHDDSAQPHAAAVAELAALRLQQEASSGRSAGIRLELPEYIRNRVALTIQERLAKKRSQGRESKGHDPASQVER